MKLKMAMAQVDLAQILGNGAQMHAKLAPYSGAGVGGLADILYIARTREDLTRAVQLAQTFEIPWRVYGGLTNVLLPDSGLRGLVILNQMRAYRFEPGHRLKVESGAIVVKVAREAVAKGLGGLTWAVGLPGTIGGAVVNNAGAFGGDTAGIVTGAEIFTPDTDVQSVENGWFEFNYRTSKLKGKGVHALVLSVDYQLKPDDPDRLRQKAEEYTIRRRRTQPPGKTLGSTFKNPEGDYAGRLIEAAGLKGFRIGGFVISERHANFFINDRNGLAEDYRALIRLVQNTVMDKSGVRLETEIEILPEEILPLASQ